MGKQTAIALTEKDEELFLDFLHSTAPICIYRTKARFAKDIRVDRFQPRGQHEWQYLISSENFPWHPELRQVRDDAPVVACRGWYYVGDASTAPVIQYSRHRFDDTNSYGRVYWAKFVASSALRYDVNSFDVWYMTIVKWLRKNGRRRVGDPYAIYYLPDAWTRHGA